jgi:hypothetical protein
MGLFWSNSAVTAWWAASGVPTASSPAHTNQTDAFRDSEMPLDGMPGSFITVTPAGKT